MLIYPSCWTWIVLACLSIGLLSVWAARRAEGSIAERFCRYFMMGSMVLVGATSIVALRIHSASWIGCGFTLSVMVVVATSDFRRSSAGSL